MKNFLIFFGGVVTGAVLIIVICFVLYTTNQKEMLGVTDNQAELYEGFENGEIINESSFKVMQVLEDNIALAYGNDKYDFYQGQLYLLIGEEGTTFYDDQIVKVPQGSVVRMNGTYQYETRNGLGKTVPRVMIMDK